MNINRDELLALAGLLGITKPEEINCEEFLALTPGYLERLREQEPAEIEGYHSFLHHLKLCPECQEEFGALCEALRRGIL